MKRSRTSFEDEDAQGGLGKGRGTASEDRQMPLLQETSGPTSASCDLSSHAQVSTKRSAEHADQASPAEQREDDPASAGDQEDKDEAAHELGFGPSRSRSPSASSSTSSRDSLFSSEDASPLPSPSGSPSSSSAAAPLYKRTSPPIPGMYFFPSLLSAELERRLLAAIGREGYFSPSAARVEQSERAEGEGEAAGAEQRARAGEERNQAMLFGRARPLPALAADGQEEDRDRWSTGLPAWADELVATLSELLRGRARDSAESEGGMETDSGRMTTTPRLLPQEVWEMLFPESSSTLPSPLRPRPQPQSRQLILNRYHPPQGLSSHVDLPHRFADGILLCSLKAGIGMRFRPAPFEHPTALTLSSGAEERSTSTPEEGYAEEAREHTHHLDLPPRSVLVLSGEARWAWEHGIEESWGDWVESEGEGEGKSQSEGEGGEGKKVGKKGKEGKARRATFIPRMERQSITIRFMKEGADCVGE